jgi:hypothetical protein
MTIRRKLDELKSGPIRHQELPPALVARIEAIRSVLDEVYPQSMAKWLDGFQRDIKPEPEVRWWERLARCYTEYNRSHDINAEQRQALFNVMLKLLLGLPKQDITPDLAKLPSTTPDDILEIMRRMGREQ